MREVHYGIVARRKRSVALIQGSQLMSFSLPMAANKNQPLTGTALIKEVCRRIRVARSYWDAHNNRACRGEREKAMALYETLTDAEKEKVPQVLRVWLRYRSEKYFGEGRTPPGSPRR